MATGHLTRRRLAAWTSIAGVVLALLLIYFFRPGPAPQAVRSSAEVAAIPTASATDTADELLSRLDAGAYDDVFDQMAGRFREGMERGHFVPSLGAIRAPLGQVRERTLRSESAAERNPEGRAGPFRVLQYLTTFDAGPRQEILVLVAEGDAWRFYSYNVAPMP
jgi:hypothetical protein